MAKKSKIIKMQKQQALIERYAEERIKFRELAHKGQIPGVKKASW